MYYVLCTITLLKLKLSAVFDCHSAITRLAAKGRSPVPGTDDLWNGVPTRGHCLPFAGQNKLELRVRVNLMPGGDLNILLAVFTLRQSPQQYHIPLRPPRV
jgi:hypothetical protein